MGYTSSKHKICEANTVMLPILPTPKQQQELIQKSIETAITPKSPTSLHKRLNDKRIEANIINFNRVVKSAMKWQKGVGLLVAKF